MDAVTSTGLNGVDLSMLAVLALSMVIGLWRGLVLEVMSLLGWFVAYFAAQWGSVAVAAYLPVGSPGSAINQSVSFAVTFFAVLLLWGLLSRLVKLLIHATPLGLIDRFFGAGFGVLRGGVLLLAITAVVARTPWVDAPAWKQSAGASWLTAITAVLKPALPASVGNWLKS